MGRALAFGIGTKPEDKTDTRLQFEAGRVPVNLISYDFVNDYLVFKAELPDGFEGTIYELALYSRLENPSAGQYSSRMLATCTSNEEWTNATYSVGGSRIGGESLTHNTGPGTFILSSMSQILMDLSGFSGQDKFSFAFNALSSVSNIQFTFLTDSANYFTFNLGALGAGYHIQEVAKNSAVTIGAPDWSTITEIQVTTTANSGLPASVQYDGIRVVDADTITPDYVMVARRVLANPYTQIAGTAQEIEFALDINIS